MVEELWYGMSFNEQMTNIGGEVERVVRKIRTGDVFDIKEYGSVKTAIGAFDCSKRDPRNKGLIKELERAEGEFIRLLEKAEKHSLKELEEEIKEIEQYWNGFLQGYCAEISCDKIFYFLVQGHESWNHDDDKWLGIYDNIRELKMAYGRAREGLRASEKEDGFSSDEEIMAYSFDPKEVSPFGGMFYERINPENL